MSTITNTVQAMSCTDCRGIVVTPIVTQTDGTFTRAVRFYGDPFVDGSPSQLFSITLTSANQADLIVTIPTSVTY